MVMGLVQAGVVSRRSALLLHDPLSYYYDADPPRGYDFVFPADWIFRAVIRMEVDVQSSKKGFKIEEEEYYFSTK